tara:strand:+ start:59 stop:1066 length:1008 start_codon:yes stop_codon:yes gene_type:complete
MQEEEKTVDIDTSGPDVDVQLPQEEPKEETNETNLKDGGVAVDTPKEPVEQSDVKPEEEKTSEDVQAVTEDAGDKRQDNRKEVEEYSESVKKRIAKLTKKMREAERQREEALRYADSVKKERDEFKTQANTLDKDYTTEMENRISGQLAAAQAKLTAARQAEDPKAETEALTAISQLGYEQGRLAELKTQNEMREKAAKEEIVQQPATQQQPTQAPDPKAAAWAEKNEWFGTDSAMTYTAFDLHRKITEEEGIDPKSDEYYEEIDKRIRLEFPHKFDKPVNKPVSKPTQTVASATRSAKTNAKTVRLTSSQVAIARKLGVPLEEYAKQLMNTKEG